MAAVISVWNQTVVWLMFTEFMHINCGILICKYSQIYHIKCDIYTRIMETVIIKTVIVTWVLHCSDTEFPILALLSWIFKEIVCSTLQASEMVFLTRCYLVCFETLALNCYAHTCFLSRSLHVLWNVNCFLVRRLEPCRSTNGECTLCDHCVFVNILYILRWLVIFTWPLLHGRPNCFTIRSTSKVTMLMARGHFLVRRGIMDIQCPPDIRDTLNLQQVSLAWQSANTHSVQM